MSNLLIQWINHSSVELENENGDVLRLKSRDGRPRFTVDYKMSLEDRLNPDTKLEDKSVTAPFNIKDFEMFLELMKTVFDNRDKEDVKKDVSVICLYHYDKDGNKTEEKLNRTKIRFYLDTDKIFKLDITDIMFTDRVTTFKLGEMYWHKYLIGNSEVPKEVLSMKHASIYIGNLVKITDNLVKNSVRVSTSERPITSTSTEVLVSSIKTETEVASDIDKQLNAMLNS